MRFTCPAKIVFAFALTAQQRMMRARETVAQTFSAEKYIQIYRSVEKKVPSHERELRLSWSNFFAGKKCVLRGREKISMFYRHALLESLRTLVTAMRSRRVLMVTMMISCFADMQKLLIVVSLVSISIDVDLTYFLSSSNSKN